MGKVKLKNGTSFDIRIMDIPARDIYNLVGAHDWRDNEQRKKERQWIIDKDPQFLIKLEQSILANGQRNPISVLAGQIYHELWISIPKWAQDLRLFCNFVGGSRLWVAQKHNMVVKCVVSDFDNRFPNEPSITNINKVYELFKDRPTKITLEVDGVRVWK